MEKYIYNEQNGLWYELQGDYYIPCLALDEENAQPIGMWGRKHLQYIKEHRPVLHTTLLLSGKLNSPLAEIDNRATEMFERVVKQLAEKEGITEQHTEDAGTAAIAFLFARQDRHIIPPSKNGQEPGLLPALGLKSSQNPADALFGKVVFAAQGLNTYACGMVAADTVVAELQFRFVVRFLSPGVAGSRLAGNVDVHTVGVLLNFPDQLLRQDFFCFYIAHGCLLAQFAS